MIPRRITCRDIHKHVYLQIHLCALHPGHCGEQNKHIQSFSMCRPAGRIHGSNPWVGRKKSRESRRPDPRHDLHLTGHSLVGRVVSCRVVLCRVGSGGVQSVTGQVGGFEFSRVGSGRVRRFFKSHGSGQVLWARIRCCWLVFVVCDHRACTFTTNQVLGMISLANEQVARGTGCATCPWIRTDVEITVFFK